MADPVGDDETFSRGIEQARAALGRPVLPRPRPRAIPDPPPEPVAPEPAAPRARRPRPRAVAVTPPEGDERDARIAELEAENRRLRAALARIAEATRGALDD